MTKCKIIFSFIGFFLFQQQASANPATLSAALNIYKNDLKRVCNVIRNISKQNKAPDFNYLIKRELKNTDLQRIKVFVDADIKAKSSRKFYSPVYTDSIHIAIDKENIELLKILILPNIRDYDLQGFISYAQQAHKPLSERYLLSRVK